MSLSVRSVSKSFALSQQGAGKIDVLKALDLEVKTGEIVAILGQSGSGKSTFLGLLSGLDSADTGSIEISGKDMSGLSPEERTQYRGEHIGIVFQQFHLIPHLTAVENVALPLQIKKDPQALAKAAKMLSDLGLGARQDHFPGMLSGGECQRVAIGRALVGQPELLLADEPSGNLDLETGDKVMELLFKMVRERRTTTVLVTHNPDLAARCDRKFFLRGGKCVPA